MKKCVLFDLDGTLVTTGGAGVQALDKAFLSIFNLSGSMDGIDPSGKTDPAIIREIFRKKLNQDCPEDKMIAVQEEYLKFLPEECESATGYRVMEGIPGILEELNNRKISAGLGTGNLERGARIKLERGNLNPHLPFGGYGSDSEDRPSLLKIGWSKAEKYSQTSISRNGVFVVGDTQRDILAARQAGFKVIAVATGHTSERILKAHNPDFYLPDFTDVGGFIDIICGKC